MACAISLALWLVLRTWPTKVTSWATPAAAEFALIAGLYSIWRLARMLPIASTDGAIDRAHDIARFEQDLHLPSELSLEHLMLQHGWLAQATTWYYASVHVPALIGFLIWMFIRHRDKYPHWRNGLVLVTLGCLIIRFIRVAPPRFLYDLGYTNLAGNWGPSVYGSDVSKGVSDQFAAMPSIHVAWAAVVSFGVVAASTSRWRWVFLPHVFITTVVVAATANHWWMDGVVAVILLAGALVLDTAVRRAFARRAASALPEAVAVPAAVGVDAS